VSRRKGTDVLSGQILGALVGVSELAPQVSYFWSMLRMLSPSLCIVGCSGMRMPGADSGCLLVAKGRSSSLAVIDGRGVGGISGICHRVEASPAGRPHHCRGLRNNLVIADQCIVLRNVSSAPKRVGRLEYLQVVLCRRLVLWTTGRSSSKYKINF
jgi:hypothetical protein